MDEWQFLKKIGMGFVVLLGLIIFSIGFFIFTWGLAYIHAPKEYGGPVKIWELLAPLAIMGLGFAIIVSPGWFGKGNKK